MVQQVAALPTQIAEQQLQQERARQQQAEEMMRLQEQCKVLAQQWQHSGAEGQKSGQKKRGSTER